MPSISTKAEPNASSEATEFSKNMIASMEKKIRNLEKRKGKLEDYKAKQTAGQKLNDEQLKAVARLDDVVQQQDLLRDLIKQLAAFNVEAVKNMKKQARRERIERAEAEKTRIAEVLSIQQVLNFMGDEDNRLVFSEGSSGVPKLEAEQLNHLDELYSIINPERSGDVSVQARCDGSAEHLQHLMDGRDKAVLGTTYKDLKSLIDTIRGCDFFSLVKSEVAVVADQSDNTTEKDFVVVQSGEVPQHDSEEVTSSLPPDVPPPSEQALSSSVADPVPQQSVYYQQQNQPTPNITEQNDIVPASTQEPKSLEKIVKDVQGSFNFIQDSEIDMDSPSHVDPAVLSVQSMPNQPAYHQQQTHTYPVQGNYPYNQQEQTSSYEQQDAPQPIPMPPAPTDNGFPQQQEQHTAPAADSSAMFDGQQQDGVDEEGYRRGSRPHRGRGGASNGRGGGGYRGGRGGRGGNYGNSDRNDRGGYRGNQRENQKGDGFQQQTSNGGNFQDRRGGRGGNRGSGPRGAPRGGRGGPRGTSGGRGGFKGQNQGAPAQQN